MVDDLTSTNYKVPFEVISLKYSQFNSKILTILNIMQKVSTIDAIFFCHIILSNININI